MSKVQQLKELYQKSVEEMIEDLELWKEFLRYAGNMYKYDFVTLVTAFVQNKDYTQLATYDAWKSIGKQVRKGEKSIPVLIKNLHGIEHFFDVSQLYETKKPWIWKVEDEDKQLYENMFLKKNKQYIDKYMTTLPDVRANMIVTQWKKVVVKQSNNVKYKDALMTDFLFNSVDYMVQLRCNCITEESNNYFSKRYSEVNPETIEMLGYYIIKISRDLLLSSKEIAMEIRREKDNERSQKNRDITKWDGHGVRGEGRFMVRSSGSGTEQGIQHTTKQVRESSHEVLGGRETNRVAKIDHRGNNDGDDAQDREESGADDGEVAGGHAKGRSNQESKQYNGDLPAQTENTRSGRGNSTSGSNLQIELDFESLKLDNSKLEGVEVATPFLNEQKDNVEKIDEISEEITLLENDSIKAQPNNNIQTFDSASKKINYHYDDLHKLYDGGIKTKFQNNVAAIRTLKQIEEDHRLASGEEQLILAKYVGWGGMASVFDETSNTWANEAKIIKNLLDESEYISARASTTTAFYTSPEIINGIYQALDQFGFQGGNILEPSMGIGNFFSVMPNKVMEHSKLYGIELDNISGRIAKQLYQTADIQICGYEEANLADNFFDVAIGNVPFGDYKVFDTRYKKHNFHIHDFFFAKTIDKVRAGGIIAFITSKGTLDKANPTVRKYLAERTDLIGAIRLPNTAFKAIANTEVSSDIIFLQKRERLQVAQESWIYTGLTDDKIPVNQYFLEHPNMLLGRMVYDTRMFGEDSKYTTVLSDSPETFITDYQNTIKELSAQIGKDSNLEVVKENSSLPADPNVKNFSYTIVEDKIYYRENSIMNLMEFPKKKLEQMKELIQIRIAVRDIINAQLDNCNDKELKELQEILHYRYDTFIKRYDRLSGKINTIFKLDADYPLLLSLEYVDKENKIQKADMFYKRTIKPYKTIEAVESPKEGLIVSLSEKGKVDIPYIAKLSNHTMDEVLEELQGEIFLNPECYDETNPYVGYESANQYLCGNVRTKLKIAKLFVNNNPLLKSNVEYLEKVQPDDLTASEIEIRLGTTWIEEEDYNAFLYDLLDTPRTYRHEKNHSLKNGKETAVHYNTFNASFSISNKTYNVTNRIRANETYGTSRCNAYNIIEDSLNLKTVIVKDRFINADGNYYYVVNKKETILAREKQILIKEKFKEWFWSDIDRREKYVRKYNDLFNNTRLRQYDGSKLVFPGMNPDIELRQHQRNAIARVIYGGNALLAHAVGAGKTYEMIASAMELKRIGLANKVMFCVPNHLTEQIGSDFLKLYPAANILVATKEDFEPLNRKTFISKIATGEYDGVIIGQTQFEKIPISKEREQEMIEQQIASAEDAIERIKSENGENWSIKQMEKFKKGLESELRLLRDSKRDNVIEFEELGIDALFCDEAHYYKNCAVFSKMRNVSGVSSSKAKKSMDMLMKCQYIQEINGGRGVVFATGTPVSNSMSELFVMQRYLQNQTLKARGLHHFDAWAANFGEVISSLELAPEGTGYRFKNRFAKFTNLPELMTMFREIADVQLPEMLQLPVPKLRENKYKIVVSKPSQYTQEVMREFAERADKIRNGNVDPSIDNMLKITNEARLLGTDPRLYNINAPNEHESKVNQCIENVYEEYVASKEVKGTQIIFCDVGTPNKNNKWSVYDYIKEELIHLGIPEQEVCFIHDAKTEKQREKMFEDLRLGNKRIIIGSTPKMGTGVNIQDRLIALHHLDCPYRPSDISQREGRILRQGNKSEEVSIYRYVTKNTFDAYSWQIVEQKQKFISQIMTNKIIQRSCEDIDDTVLSYAEVKALATGNPLIKEKMDIDTEVARLKLLKTGFLNQKYKYEEGYQKIYPREIKEYEKKILDTKEDIGLRNSNSISEDSFCITLMDKVYTERPTAGETLSAILSMKEIPKVFGNYRGFVLSSSGTDISQKSNTILFKGANTYHLELGNSSLGNISRIENLLGNLDEMLEVYEEKLEINESNLQEAKLNSQKVFEHEDELERKIKRQIELNQLLELDKKDEVLMDGESDIEKGKDKNLKELVETFDRINGQEEKDYDLEIE